MALEQPKHAGRGRQRKAAPVSYTHLDMPDVINIKAAGTAMRFMTAYLSATPGEQDVYKRQVLQQTG